MKKTFLNMLLVYISLCTANTAISQGCSDAGFCTINSFKPESGDSANHTRNDLKIGCSYGSADNGITVFGSYFEYNIRPAEKFELSIKLTSLAQSGNDISVFGLSDVLVSSNYKIHERIKLTAGVKIPLSNASNTENGQPLPLDYQSSLGTFDLICGVGYDIKKVRVTTALQLPLTQNKNQFFAENYPIDSKLRQFQSTNKFNRSADVLLRVSYPFALGNKFTITPSILPIYHLRNDRYTDTLNMEREIIGSSGLTLNGTLYFDYQLSARGALQLNAGMPFITREVRPDGLTRHFIITLEYLFRF